MRTLLLAAAAVLLPQASTAAPPKVGGNLFAPSVESSIQTPPSTCRRPTAYVADENSLAWRDDKLQPRKLTELPPAQGYMAVYRVTNGCEDPMTMVEYRTGRRR